MNIGAWLRDRPRWLEAAFKATHILFEWANPILKHLGYGRADRWMRPVEEFSKSVIFDCRMCGQCILHSSGMTCPMTCPKNLRNGPCGGVRVDGNCEVIPEMRCVWVEAFERSEKMGDFGPEIMIIQPPVNRLLLGSSAWINALSGADKDVPDGWREASQHTLFDLYGQDDAHVDKDA
jgi:hypothetical protein